MEFSYQQRRVIQANGVVLIGVDAKNRPVVSQMSGIPHQLRKWSILRNGDPTDITEPMRKVHDYDE